MAIPALPGDVSTQAAACPPGQYLHSGTGLCSPDTGQPPPGGGITCQVGEILDAATGQCVPDTTNTAIPPVPNTGTGTTDCGPDQYWVHGIGCVSNVEKCPHPDEYQNPSTGECTMLPRHPDYVDPGGDWDPYNPNNPAGTGGNCPDGYTLVPATGHCQAPNGQCYDQNMQKVDCGDSVPPVGGNGQCLQGEVWNGTSCVPDDNVTEGCQTPGYIMGPDGVCHPPTGDGTGCPDGWVAGENGSCFDPNADVGDHGEYVPGDGVDPGDPFDVGTSPDPLDTNKDTEDYYGVDPVNVAVDDADYDEVRDFIDNAYKDFLRTNEPQEQLEDERFKQELINQGIDPYSAAGQKALMQKERAQNDRRSKGYYDAQAAGIATQGQMFDQGAVEAGFAGGMNELVTTLTQRAHEFDITAGMTADQINWGKIADTMGWNRQDFYDWRDDNRWIDSIILTMAGLTPPAQYVSNPVNPATAVG